MNYKDCKTAEILIDVLIQWGVKVIFGIPGDGINGIMEAIRIRKDDIHFVLTRHEESAAFMACAYSKYTGNLGACLATTGPGATNLLTGLYDAKADGASVIAITGSTYSDLIGSKYQQDVNLLQLFSDVAIYNNMINSPEHTKMATDLACRTAIAKRGVAHLTIPIDIQEKKLDGGFSTHKVAGHTSQQRHSVSIPEMNSLKNAADYLNASKKIVILAGQGALNARKEILNTAEKLKAPIVKALLGKAVIPDDNPYNLGGLGMLGTEPATEAMENADTLLMIGTSFPYSDYLPEPKNVIGIQIDDNSDRIGLRYPVKVGLVGDASATLNVLLPLLNEHTDNTFLKQHQKSMKKWNELINLRSNRDDEVIKPQMFASLLSENLDNDAIISVDSGTNTVWAARYINIRDQMKFSLSGTLSSMACGVPYSIAAQIAFPKRQCIAFVGDGGLAMLMSEFSTAVKYNLPIKVFVIKNNTLGMIRWEQTAFLGNPEYGVEFQPIDFVKVAEACGGKGYTIKNTLEIESSIKTALQNKAPTIVEVYVDPFEPPMPPKVDLGFVNNMAKSFVKGQPYSKRIALTIIKNQMHEKLSGLLKTNKDKERG